MPKNYFSFIIMSDKCSSSIFCNLFFLNKICGCDSIPFHKLISQIIKPRHNWIIYIWNLSMKVRKKDSSVILMNIIFGRESFVYSKFCLSIIIKAFDCKIKNISMKIKESLYWFCFLFSKITLSSAFKRIWAIWSKIESKLIWIAP